MWPWGHVAVAYLLYTIYTHRRDGRPPRALPAIAVVVGSQFPDLIDKPLAWSFGVLPGGRTLSHSLFFVALLIPVVYSLALQIDRLDVAAAFLLGHVSHLVADVPPAALTGDFEGATYFLWPLLEQPEYESVDGILAAFLDYSMGPYEWLQLALFVAAAIVWYRDGMPGVTYARGRLERYVAAVR